MGDEALYLIIAILVFLVCCVLPACCFRFYYQSESRQTKEKLRQHKEATIRERQHKEATIR